MKEKEGNSVDDDNQAVENMFSVSERIYEYGSRDDIKVPFRRVLQEKR